MGFAIYGHIIQNRDLQTLTNREYLSVKGVLCTFLSSNHVGGTTGVIRMSDKTQEVQNVILLLLQVTVLFFHLAQCGSRQMN